MNLVKQLPCMAPSLCDLMLKEVEHSSFGREMMTDGDGHVVVGEGRSNSLCDIPESFSETVLSVLNETISNWSRQVAEECPDFCQQLKLPGVTPGLKTRLEKATILRYEQSQEYKWHIDQPLPLNLLLTPYGCETRNWSIVLYLNDDFEGGETQVLEDVYTPKKGTALVFPSSWHYPHTALPVKQGIKYALVTWYHQEFD